MGRILIVDDEVAIGQVLGAYFKRLGHDTTVVTSLADAEKEIAERNFCLVICDMFLGDGVSVDFIKHVKASCDYTSLIAMSGCSQVKGEDIFAKALKAGASATMTKPFTLNEIKAKVDEFCTT